MMTDERDRGVILSLEEETKNVSLARVSEEEELSLPIRVSVGHQRRKLLVLDLNGVLVDVVSPCPKDCKPDITIARRAIFKRPFCLEFLRFCFERFEVAVWSSRTKKNAERVIDFLMGDIKRELLFSWDQSHCTVTEFSTLENKHKAVVFKELQRIWENEDHDLPWKKVDYNESNTLLLDDSPYKASLNPMHTAVFPYPYKYQDKSDNSLGDGGDLRVYLEGLAAADNVQEFVQRHPFGQAAITESSESWSFYLQVINSVHNSRRSRSPV